MKKQRLAFAKMYVHWTTDEWKKVMFSDESNFQVFRMGSTTVPRPRTSDRFERRYTVPTVKHPESVILWGRFSGNKERGGLYFLPKNKKVNADLYVKVLVEHMLNFFLIHGSEVFMQDNAPCHKVKKMTRFLEQQQINVLEWKGNSPDVNPIENCWQKMTKLCQKRKPLTWILSRKS